jgi:hypothetical protein
VAAKEVMEKIAWPMPERLTESLIRRGLLDSARAREAMQRQVLLGGALDTCLLELHLVEEEALLDAMGSAYGLATANAAESTADVDSRAARAFPEQWAKKHGIAPLSFDTERMILSVISPAPPDVNLLVRLGELLEVTIKPMLAPEFRVQQRLAMLYEEKPPERYLALIQELGGAGAPAAHARTVDTNIPLIVTRPLTFGEAVTRLKEARDRDDIVRTALAYAHRELEFAAMFVVHDNVLDGWNKVGESARKISEVSIELSAGSAFRVVLDTQAHYLGPLPADELHLDFLEQIGRPHPRAALIVPVRIKSRTIALMYGENGPRTIPPRLAADLMLFTTHVQGALEALLIRRKTESMSEPTSAISRAFAPALAPSSTPVPAPSMAVLVPSEPHAVASMVSLDRIVAKATPTPVAPSFVPRSWSVAAARDGDGTPIREAITALPTALESAPPADAPAPTPTPTPTPLFTPRPLTLTPVEKSAPLPSAPESWGSESERPTFSEWPRSRTEAMEHMIASELATSPPESIAPPTAAEVDALIAVAESSLPSAPPIIPSLPPPAEESAPRSDPPRSIASAIEIGPPIESMPARPTLGVVRPTEYTYVRRDGKPAPLSSEQPPAAPVVAEPTLNEALTPLRFDPDTDALAGEFQPASWDKPQPPAEALEGEAEFDTEDWSSVEVQDDEPLAPAPAADAQSAKDALLGAAAMSEPEAPASSAIRETTNYSTPYEALAATEGFEQALSDALSSAVIEDDEKPATPAPAEEADDFAIVEATPTPVDHQAFGFDPEPPPPPTRPIMPPRKASAPTILTVRDPDEAPAEWDAVQVDSWDEWAQRASNAEQAVNAELKQSMRASLAEDSTLPDLSAEAWLRASSDLVRPRTLPPEVMERAAMDSPEEPVPLTTLRPKAEPDAPDHPEHGDDEPVPLTRPASSSRREPVSLPIDHEVPIQVADSEPIRFEEPILVRSEPIKPGIELPPQSLTVPDFRLSGPSVPASESTQVLDELGRTVSKPVERAPPSSPPPSTPLEAEVVHLVDTLVSADASLRRSARDRLMAMGPFVLPRVMDRFPGFLSGDPFSANAALPGFADASELLAVLASFGVDAHPHVIRKLDTPDPRQRFFAAYFYGVVFVPEAIPRLVQRLHDEEPRICMLAARTLFAYRELPEFQAVLEHLHGRLEASSIAARRHAAYLIGLFRDVTAVPLLIAIFDKKEKLLFDASENALAEITKQRLGPSSKKWRVWWMRNQGRSRIGWLVDGLGSKEAAMRRSAAEELRAVTGVDFGYDEDLPKREREGARLRWVKWWHDQYNLHHGHPDGEPVSPP